MSWVDSHCHLDSLDQDLDEVLLQAAGAGVDQMITIGTDLPSSMRAAELARRHDAVWASVGIHPYDAEGYNPQVESQLADLAAQPRVVAIGEAGLDFYRDLAGPAAQERAFAAQIALAKRCGLPLVMHIREAFAQVLAILEREGPPPSMVFHCFGDGPEEAARAVALGGYVSFAGNVSYKSAGRLREAVGAVPLDRLLVETDSPYLAPVPHRGRPNQPRNVVDVGAAVARALEIEVEKIETATSRNARRVFGLGAAAG